MHYDLIVIGMGLSGLMAAKTAAEAGQKVLIVGKGMGSLCLFSNTIDILGTIPRTTKMRGGLSQWIKDHPEHPYSKVGLEKIEEALSSFLSLFPPPYSFQTIANMNCLLPTGAGTLRPTYFIPSTMVAGASFREGHTLIVGFKGFKDFYAHYVADQLKCRGITLSFPDVLHQDMTATALARLMEKKSFTKNISKEIKKQLHGETRVGFPALLGMNDPVQVKEDLEEIIGGAKVFEIPTLPPSIPGMRIFNRFKEWLIQKGVTFLLGYSVSKAKLGGKRCEGIEALHPPVITSYSADRYILATGRFIGGGLKADTEKVFEPIFKLPVHQPRSREDWFEKNLFTGAPHPIHQAGILTDPSLQPVDERGDLILENIWVAGSILAHHHCFDEKSREGIEIATGYAAARYGLGTLK
ncbi:MAG: anaerobic glycerol-3-phosphate dehydrogenase subunit B [Deltaproteobacteria bacterium CG_4_8_14_3_um_filter_45_9]|nr:MAG: anaerobic glycerol-3-phosphate dehydrogenase subunit B [Deltaproteobacteria bacterium CG_4_8_14_3_um_filter_45_9]